MNTKLETMLLTKSAAAKILECYPSEILSVRLSPDGKQVLVEKIRIIQIVKIGEFYRQFALSRKQRAEGLTAVQDSENPFVFYVSSASGNNPYKVLLSKHGVNCFCDDFSNQLQAFEGDSCCKHAYCILHNLGFETLREYREAWSKPGATLAKIIESKKATVKA